MTVPPFNPEECTELGTFPFGTCTLEGTLYGYYPSIGANGFFAAFFGLCLLLNLGFGIKWKTWTYMIALSLGCLAECVGYIGRIMIYNDPFTNIGFQLQISLLIIAPAFVTAGIYVTLKHFVITFGEEWSRLRPAWYTYIFIAGDILALILQGAGGGLAATADPGSSLLDVGTDLMIAGVIFQVVILFVFGCLLAEYTLKTYNRRANLSPEALNLMGDLKFRLFVGAILTAWITTFARCVYRIPELTGGWRSELMRNEAEFIALEGMMIVLAVLALTVFHPGYCFPVLANTFGKKNASTKTIDSSEEAKV